MNIVNSGRRKLHTFYFNRSHSEIESIQRCNDRYLNRLNTRAVRNFFFCVSEESEFQFNLKIVSVSCFV